LLTGPACQLRGKKESKSRGEDEGLLRPGVLVSFFFWEKKKVSRGEDEASYIRGWFRGEREE